MKNIYILTEEKPKISTIKQLFQIYRNDFDGKFTINEDLKIIPNIDGDVFKFSYELIGITLNEINKVIIKIVSGSSSFMDFLFFISDEEPNEDLDIPPLFAVEETKTSDDESRNTGVYQRCSKFVFIEAFYHNVPKYMLYNDELELREEKKPSDTSIFGTNMLLTNNVKIVGKPINKWFSRFLTIDDLIEFKDKMKRPPESNTPILIKKYDDYITISGRLDKPQNINKISHDPNIGCLSIIALTLRKLGWNKDIIIVSHHISQEYINHTKGHNKFLYICKILNIKMEGLTLPLNYQIPNLYWHYEKSSEKVASILFHLQTENLGFFEVYQNHAGCERGYFKTKEGKLITLPKKTPSGNNLLIPDVIMRDDANKTIYLMEGKKLSTLQDGLKEINDYDDIEKLYIEKYFPEYVVKRYLTIFGGYADRLPDEKVLLYVRSDGKILINEKESNIYSNFLSLTFVK